MTHIVTSSHFETLKSGRMVFPGAEVSDEEAAANPRLVDRGALTPRGANEAERKAAEEAAAAEAKEAEEKAVAEQAAAASTGSSAGGAQEAQETKPTPPKSRRSKAPATPVPNKEDDPK